MTVNRGTLNCGPADKGPMCSLPLPTCRCKNESRRSLCRAGGANIGPAKLLLFARCVVGPSSCISESLTSDLSDLIDRSDSDWLRSVSEDEADSGTTSRGESVDTGGLDTFFGLCIFAMRQRI